MQKPNILIVDDDKDIVSAIDTVLTMEGYNVEKAYKGSECINCVKEIKPDLILLDLMLPDMHGAQVAQKLRRDKATEAIPIVVISASRDGREISKTMQVQDYIEKPFDIKDLLSTVSRHLPN